MKRILAAIGIMIIVALGSYTYSTIKTSHYMFSGPTTISVTGVGEVTTVPDIGSFNFIVEAKDPDSTVAQNKTKETMNAVLAFLKEKGVDEKDVKTENYNLNPEYENSYPVACREGYECPPVQSNPKIIGYIVTQSVTVKVRDMAKSGELISGVGSKGVTNISGLTFTVDKMDSFKDEARAKAITDAQEQAQKLAKDLHTRLVRMTGYWEDVGNGEPMPYSMGGGMGMGAMAKDASVAQPATLPVGEGTFRLTVNMNYEIE